MQANPYLYVLDRGTGQFLAGFPFVANRAITGTPTTPGTYTFAAAVSDDTGLPAGASIVACTITIAQ